MTTISTKLSVASYTIGLLLATPKEHAKTLIDKIYAPTPNIPAELISHTEIVHDPSKTILDVSLYTCNQTTSIIDLTFAIQFLDCPEFIIQFKKNFLANPIPAYGILSLLPDERKSLPMYKEENMLDFAYRKQIHMGFTKSKYTPNFIIHDDEKGPKGYLKFNWSKQLYLYNLYKLNQLTSA